MELTLMGKERIGWVAPGASSPPALSYHRQEEKEVKEKDYYCSERSSGSFYRSISLPEGVKAESIQASYQNGVLEVVVPRPATAAAKAVKVPVK